MMNLYLLVALIFCSSCSWAQDLSELETNQLYFPQEILKDRGILSAHVLMEQKIVSNYSGDVVLSKKRMELEFNEQGLPIYKRFSPLVTDFYGELDALGGRKTRYCSYEYDDSLRLTEVCESHNYGTMCTRFRFDDNGKLISLSYDADDTETQSYNFDWGEDGNLENVRYYGDYKPSMYYNLDTEGKLSRIKHHNEEHTLFSYADENDTSRIDETRYHHETRLAQKVSKKFISTDQLFFQKKSTPEHDTVFLKQISYDEHHQVTTLTIYDQSERIEFFKHYPEAANVEESGDYYIPEPFYTRCHITNFYDDLLLIKRELVFYYENGSMNKEIGTITERISYETSPLPSKPWKFDEEEQWDR